VRRRTLAIAGTGLLALAVAAVALAVTPGDAGSAVPAAAAVPATAEIDRRDLVDTKTVDGALTYADERRVTTYASGTVTWVPEEGATVRRGRPLLRVDRDPVVLMYGELPLYRTLYWGVSDGPDVEQLERNLKKLGYGDDLTVDDHFSHATHQAVLEWQDDQGLPETGRVDAAQVVFLPGAARVTEAKVAVGDRIAPGRPALTVTGTERVVQVALDTDDQHLVKKGDKVTVELPGGERTPGTISSVGTVAKTSGREDDGDTTIDVEITLRKRPKTRLDRAPVEVELVSERVRDVLTVPVEALLALREGGFGVEVVEGSATRIVPVEIGAFGSGRVEIKGTGLAEGMKVGVPAS